MVKPDPKHDYYADLEVPPASDADTIKKQFRLLGEEAGTIAGILLTCLSQTISSGSQSWSRSRSRTEISGRAGCS